MGQSLSWVPVGWPLAQQPETLGRTTTADAALNPTAMDAGSATPASPLGMPPPLCPL
jgi:hypothetical protein